MGLFVVRKRKGYSMFCSSQLLNSFKCDLNDLTCFTLKVMVHKDHKNFEFVGLKNYIFLGFMLL